MTTAASSLFKSLGSVIQTSGPLGKLLERLAAQADASAGSAIRFAEKVYGAAVNLVTQVGQTQVIVEIPFTTLSANEKVGVSFSADRFNADVAGGGFYQYAIDGVAVGAGRNPVGNIRSTISFEDIFTIASAGSHLLQIQVTPQVDAETTVALPELQAVGYGAI